MYVCGCQLSLLTLESVSSWYLDGQILKLDFLLVGSFRETGCFWVACPKASRVLPIGRR
mgnify:CR=1 FL=1